MTGAELFILTGLNGMQWLAVVTACVAITASAIWVHRRDRCQHRESQR